jgi:hypothetical protein
LTLTPLPTTRRAGDLYTAYTFIAVPALAFGAGAVAFFAVPYTIMIYPILFLVFPRLWHVCHKRQRRRRRARRARRRAGQGCDPLVAAPGKKP